MCGLAGMIGLNGRTVDATALERMAFSLQHRGPDDKGMYVNGAVGFGFRRLSILDLSPGGHQPKVSRDGKELIQKVFNPSYSSTYPNGPECPALCISARDTLEVPDGTP